ncbi:MAG TPA: hypothetical protein PLZ64_01075 [Chitinophagales bacterium]|nr:hypothetical protein [Chitinophagales bacterium]
MNRILHYAFLLIALSCNYVIVAQSPNNCVNAVNVCNNQLAEKLDDGPGVQECPNGGCGCMLAGEKNTRWFRVVIQTAGVLEFTISPIMEMPIMILLFGIAEQEGLVLLT